MIQLCKYKMNIVKTSFSLFGHSIYESCMTHWFKSGEMRLIKGEQGLTSN